MIYGTLVMQGSTLIPLPISPPPNSKSPTFLAHSTYSTPNYLRCLWHCFHLQWQPQKGCAHFHMAIDNSGTLLHYHYRSAALIRIGQLQNLPL